MTVQLAIIGLGQIGTSVGLALAEHSDMVTRLGHDRDPDIARQARQMGAVDQIFDNLPAAVENAGLVLLALPADQIRDTLQIIAPCLQAHTVVMDTSPVKGTVAEWMKASLPQNCHYVGLTPAINPLYLSGTEKGITAAHADLFAKGVMAIAAPQGTDGAAVELAADLSTLLKAAPLFIDLVEVDGMMAALHIMPQLYAAALANVVMDSPGWGDARKLAGRVYTEATTPIVYDDESDALVEATLQNRMNVLRVIDEMLIELKELRETISIQEQEQLRLWLTRARQGRSKWLRERNLGDWRTTGIDRFEIPKRNLLKRWFGDPGRLFGRPKPGKEEQK